MAKKYLYLGLIILGTAFWGISFTFTKTGMAAATPVIFVAYKFLIAALVLGVVVFRQLSSITRDTVRASLFISIPLLAGTLLQTTGLQYTTVANVAFITGLDVLLIPLFKYLFYKKTVAPKTWIACIICLAGLYVITVQHGLSINYGDLLIIACSVGFACYIIQTGQLPRNISPLPVMALVMLWCGIGALCLALPDASSVWLPAEPVFWAGVLFAAIPATAYMYAIQSIAQRYLTEEQIVQAFLFEPLFAAIAAWLVLGETITYPTLVGGGMIMAAIGITEIKWLPRLAERE
ncbi:DMT family transporter [Chitinophaga nivalis]|uniref:DMT family transporter n=1 Tax=Chitinophaga nivalis TaxID=2991709 RepID=A0ABT3IMU5_9BACT|nr:DMT family transporter [Chitinophaga nivalis]MCW3465045.1 DMT family transporter [Chitinophaga nivalis]MCW3485263.1 DMT family transporter [Chitinophaga nivalis]